MALRRALFLAVVIAWSLLAPVAQDSYPVAAAQDLESQDKNPVLQQEGNRAALVIDKGDAGVEQYCVGFPEAEITGYEALQRAGLTVATDMQAGGAAVCQIGDTGCPADNCFCACRGGGTCVYWSYWHQRDGAWEYSMAGSSLSPVSDGAVEGWVWGPGSVTEASPPPAVAFADVCGAGATVVSTSVEAAGGTPAIQETGATVSGWLPYAAFAGLLALLGALAVLARRRGGGG